MPVDTSFYNTQPPQPVIPGGLPGVVGLANAYTQNKILGTENQMLQNQFQGNMALGNIYQNSLNADGTVNPAAVNRGIAAGGPGVGYVAPQAYQSTANLQQTYLGNQGAQVTQAGQRMNDYYNSLAALPPDQKTRAGAINLAAQFISAGRLLPTDMPAIIGDVPLRDADVSKFIASKQASTLTPAQQAAPATIAINPETGQITTGTTGQFVQKVSPTAPNQEGGITTTLPVGQAESMKANVDAYNADLQGSAATLANTRKLENALPLVRQLNHTSFGPGSTELNNLQSAFITAGVLPEGTSVANAASLRMVVNKYLKSYAGNASYAGRSDQALSQALGSNPNLDLTQGANLDLLRNQIAMNKEDAAIPLAFAKEYPGVANQSKYLGYKANFYQNNDQRAFGIDNLEPDERRDLQGGLGIKTGANYQKFVQSYQRAKAAGVLQPPQAQQ